MLQSPPSWRRGLKSKGLGKKHSYTSSPPSWRRGLKFRPVVVVDMWMKSRLLLGGVD